MAIECDVGYDGHHLVAALTGHLDLRDVAALRSRLLKCLAEQPDAMLVDLSGFSVGEPLALAVFTAVVRQAARWPGVPVLFCAPTLATRLMMDQGAFRRLPVFHSVSAARRHIGMDRRILPSFTEELLPVFGAPRQARNFATDACLRWDLAHLVAPASLIVSELVSNVVDHAHTMATLRLSLRRRFVTIALRDGSPEEPVISAALSPESRSGRGLLLVQESAHSWGWLPTDGGKVVWASLTR